MASSATPLARSIGEPPPSADQPVAVFAPIDAPVPPATAASVGLVGTSRKTAAPADKGRNALDQSGPLEPAIAHDQRSRDAELVKLLGEGRHGAGAELDRREIGDDRHVEDPAKEVTVHPPSAMKPAALIPAIAAASSLSEKSPKRRPRRPPRRPRP